MRTLLLALLMGACAMPSGAIAAADQAVAPTRGKTIDEWASEHAAAVKAAIDPASPVKTALQTRATASALGPLTDGEVSDLIVAASANYINSGDGAEALVLGRGALAWSRAMKLGPAYEFDALVRTGSALYVMADYAGAARDMQESVTQARAIVPFDANAVANATANYAVVLDANGRYRDSEAALESALKLRLSATPIRPEGLSTVYASLAGVQKRLGRFDLAEDNYRRALGVMERASLATSRQYVRILHNYAVLVSDEGRDEEAVRMYRRALELTAPEKRMEAGQLPDHSALASALVSLGRLEEAEAAIANSIAIADKLAKPTADVAPAYNTRARIRAARGDLPGAEADQRRALAVDRLVLGGDNNLAVPGDLAALAGELRRTGKLAEADTVSAEAVKLLASVPARNAHRAVILDIRAATLASSGRKGEALASSRAASEALAERFELEQARDPGPVPPDQRPIMGRRVSLAWDAAHP
ncbi:MAG: tetratricopeptide repeat protein [Sphingomonas bacterium]